MINTSLTLAPKWMQDQGGGRQPGQLLMQSLQLAHQIDVNRANQKIAADNLLIENKKLQLMQTKADADAADSYARLQLQQDQSVEQAEVMAAKREDAAEMNKVQMARQRGETYVPMLKTPEFQRTYAIWKASDAEAKADQKIIDRYTDIVLWDPTAKTYIAKGTDGWMERMAEIGGQYDYAVEQRNLREISAKAQAAHPMFDANGELRVEYIEVPPKSGNVVAFAIPDNKGDWHVHDYQSKGQQIGKDKILASVTSTLNSDIKLLAETPESSPEYTNIVNRINANQEIKKQLMNEALGKTGADESAPKITEDPLGLFK